MSVPDDVKTGLNQATEVEKQNKIAKDLCSKYGMCTCVERDGHCTTPQQHAKILMELGYAKEEDVIKEVQRRINDTINHPSKTSINVRTAVGMQMLVEKVLKEYLKEVKNKHSNI